MKVKDMIMDCFPELYDLEVNIVLIEDGVELDRGVVTVEWGFLHESGWGGFV